MFEDRLRGIESGDEAKIEYEELEAGPGGGVLEEDVVNNDSSNRAKAVVVSSSVYRAGNICLDLTPFEKKAYKLIMLAATGAAVSHFITEGLSDPAVINALWAMALMSKSMGEFNDCKTPVAPTISAAFVFFAILEGMLCSKDEVYNFVGAASFIPLLLNDIRLLCKIGMQSNEDKYEIAGSFISALSKLYASMFFLIQWSLNLKNTLDKGGNDLDSDENRWLLGVDVSVPVAILITSIAEIIGSCKAVRKKGSDHESSMSASLLAGHNSLMQSPLSIRAAADTNDERSQNPSNGADISGLPCPPIIGGGSFI